jgi:hypothetical protein
VPTPSRSPRAPARDATLCSRDQPVAEVVPNTQPASLTFPSSLGWLLGTASGVGQLAALVALGANPCRPATKFALRFNDLQRMVISLSNFSVDYLATDPGYTSRLV